MSVTPLGRAAGGTLLLVAAACTPRSASTPLATTDVTVPSGVRDAAAAGEAEASIPQLDPDGDDDPAPEQSAGSPPAAMRFVRVGAPPLALQRICDLTPLGDALYAAHARQPLGTDGATISRYKPANERRPFAVAFDWNRPGEPTRGGGAGQGFLRVHAVDGRLFVPDTDPPYAGFGLADRGTEGYVFVSDASGGFAAAVAPGHRPPASPSPGADGHAGASILPRAYHVIDTIRFRGRLYASTGSVPPGERAWSGPSPGALHVAESSWARWTYEIDYPWPWQNGVWRLTFLVRFHDRLYAGIQDYDGREPNDYVLFTPPLEAPSIDHEHVRGVRVTQQGAALTLRWYAEGGRLWWIALEKTGAVALRVTSDGDTWRTVPLPEEAGRPTDVTRYRGALVALTERGLWRIDLDPPLELARVEEKRSPFAIDDAFCAAPLAVFRGDLYAGDQRSGSLWRIEPL